MRADLEEISFDPGAPGALSKPNRKLSELARQAARCARPLLSGGELFLALELGHDGELRLIWWRRRDFRPVAEISATPDGFCAAESDEGALQDAAVALLDYLGGRWPLPPGALGVITDGTGVAFAPDHPAPSAPGWLLRHASGAGALAMILDFDPSGPCALFSPQPAAKSLH